MARTFLDGRLPGWASYVSMVIAVVLGVFAADALALGTVGQLLLTLLLLVVVGRAFVAALDV